MTVQSSIRRSFRLPPAPALAGARRQAALLCCAAALAMGVSGCGGSGDGGGSNLGALSARVFWQQPDSGDDAQLSGTSPGGGFGSELPAAVRTVRLDFAPAAGGACCVAIDPSQLTVDPDTGRRRVVLTGLLAGPGQLTIAGFPGSTATAPPGAAGTCELEPAGVASPCVAGALDGPSFLSEPTAVTVRAGTQVNAGDILVPAVPFFITATLQPPPGGSVASPVQLGATVAISGTDLPIDQIAIATNPGGAAAVTLTACDDLSGPPCSPGGSLEVRGLRAVGQNTVAPGAAAVDIAASGDGATALRLAYGFTASGAPPPASPTATQPAAATATSTAAATPATPATPAATRTQTVVPPTPTFTPTPTGQATATSGSPTATPDAMCGATPAQGCLRPLDGSRSSLVIGADSNPDNDRLVYEWERGNFVDGRDFGDPGLTTSYAICIYDDVGGVSTLARQLFVPPTSCTGNGCWSVTDDGFRYSDTIGRRDGVGRIDLVAGQPGSANILVRAGGANLAPPQLPFAQDPTVIIQIKNDFEEGQCWETRFTRPAERNDAALFRDTGDNAIGN